MPKICVYEFSSPLQLRFRRRSSARCYPTVKSLMIKVSLISHHSSIKCQHLNSTISSKFSLSVQELKIKNIAEGLSSSQTDKLGKGPFGDVYLGFDRPDKTFPILKMIIIE